MGEPSRTIEKPADARQLAANLRKWSGALKIPSGDFINEDLEDAARLLENYATFIDDLLGERE